MKTVRNILSVFVAVSFALSAQAQTRGVAAPVNNLANPTAAAAPAPADTIQSSGSKSSGKNMVGVLMGVAAAGFCAVKIPPACFSATTNRAMCALYVAGLAASVMVTANMMKAKKTSDGTVDAVTVGGNTNSSSALPPAINGSPDWQAAQSTLAALKEKGWKIDTDKGVVTDPSGKSYTSDQFSSSAGIAKAGGSGQMAELTAAQKSIGKAAEAKVKAADGSDMFGGEIGGGGGKPAISVDGSLGNDSPTGAVASTQGLGINRDPAQVAGMTKNLGGDPIGVSGDSLFKMIDRRYELHNTQGSFLTGP
jgi:hypothetical protein